MRGEAGVESPVNPPGKQVISHRANGQHCTYVDGVEFVKGAHGVIGPPGKDWDYGLLSCIVQTSHMHGCSVTCTTFQIRATRT